MEINVLILNALVVMQHLAGVMRNTAVVTKTNAKQMFGEGQFAHMELSKDSKKNVEMNVPHHGTMSLHFPQSVTMVLLRNAPKMTIFIKCVKKMELD